MRDAGLDVTCNAETGQVRSVRLYGQELLVVSVTPDEDGEQRARQIDPDERLAGATELT